MKKNMGSIDRALRILAAIVIASLYFGKFISGTVAELFGLNIGVQLAIPGGLFEITLSIWLIIKGKLLMSEEFKFKTLPQIIEEILSELRYFNEEIGRAHV